MTVYLLSCLSPFIPPSSFSYLSLLALVFPFLFAAALLCAAGYFFIKKGAALLILLVIIAAGFKNLHSMFAFNLPGWQMQKQTGSLRIMTWNVETFLNFYPSTNPASKPRFEMYDVIKQYNPDVLCVQEMRDVQGPDFGSSKKEVIQLGYPYVYFSNDSIEPIDHADTAYSGVAIFSRLPLTDSARINIRNKGMNENMIYADIALGNKKLRIFTGHLASLNLYIDTLYEPSSPDNIYEKTYKRKRKIEYRFREGEITHEQETAIIRQQIKASPYPAVYCGDNNATPASYNYHYLKADMKDAFIQKGSGFGGTFYKILPTLRIDVCFVNSALNILQCTVPQAELSDHFPVVTDIAWKKN